MRGLILSAALAVGLASVVFAGPVPSTGPLPAKIEELEAAGNLLQQNKVEEAYKQVQEACKKYPVLPPPRLIMARMFARLNAQNTRQVLELAAAENPHHPEIYLELARAALSDGRVSDSILNSAKALELSADPRWTVDQKTGFQREARAGLAAGFEFRRDWANVRTQLLSLLELEPKNGQVRQRYGQALFNSDPPKYDEAYAEFQVAAKDDPTLMPAAVLMARQYQTKGDQAKAAEFFDKAVKQESNSGRVHVSYAEFLLQQDKYDAAKIHTDTAAKLDPKNIDVQRMQAFTARYGRDYAAATRILEELLRSSPDDFFASNQLALVLADMSDDASKKRAMKLAEINYRQYNKNLDALGTLGYCYYRNQNVQLAQQALAQIVQSGRASPDAAYFLALVLVDMKHEESHRKQALEEAKNFLKSAMETKDVFFFRKEAAALHTKLTKDLTPTANEKDKSKSKSFCSSLPPRGEPEPRQRPGKHAQRASPGR